MQSQYQTVNSFSRRPSLAQIVSYFIFILQSIFFYALIQPYYDSTITRTILIVFYSCTEVILIISTCISSCQDPSDSIMIATKRGSGNQEVENLNQLLYCEQCKTYVHQSSKHCRSCDRCVQKFDHHCIWINNCIGGKNYKVFLVMISAAFSLFLEHFTAVLLLTTQYKWDSFLGIMIANWASLVITIIFLFLIFNLILLHLYLGYLELTTYEFLLKRKEEEQRQLIEERLNKNKDRINELIAKKQDEQVQEKIKKNTVIPFTPAIEDKFSEKNRQTKLEEMYQTIKVTSKDITMEKMEESSSVDLNKKELEKEDESDNQIRISAFFIRNKSLNLLISTKEPIEPVSRPIVSACGMIEKKEIKKEKKKKTTKSKREIS